MIPKRTGTAASGDRHADRHWDGLVHYVCETCSPYVAYCGTRVAAEVVEDTDGHLCLVCMDLATSNNNICKCERNTP